MNPPAAGWQPDPSGRHDYRYWDGAGWTDDVSDNGQTSVDPMGPGVPSGATSPGEATAVVDATQQYGASPPYGGQAGGYGTPSGDYPPQTGGYGAPSGDYPPETGGYGTQPGSYGAPPTGYGGQPGYGTQPGGYGAPPGFGTPPGVQSGQYAPSPYGAPVKKGPPPALILGLIAIVLVAGGVGAWIAFGGDDDQSSPPTTEATETTAAPGTSATTATTAPATTASTAPSGPENTNVFALAVGDCLVDPSAEGEVSEVPVVPCDQPHTGEIFYSHIMTETDLPNDAAMQGIVDQECVSRFEGFVGLPYEDSALSVSWLSPTAESWESGDRELLCIVNGPSNEVVGTLEGSNR